MSLKNESVPSVVRQNNKNCMPLTVRTIVSRVLIYIYSIYTTCHELWERRRYFDQSLFPQKFYRIVCVIEGHNAL